MKPKRGSPMPLKENELAKVTELYLSGIGVATIATRMRVRHSQVHRYLEKQGILRKKKVVSPS